jgi:hypothetical protein
MDTNIIMHSMMIEKDRNNNRNYWFDKKNNAIKYNYNVDETVNIDLSRGTILERVSRAR